METYKQEEQGKNSGKRKKCYRIAPCPEYDFRGMEKWLEDMARKGCHLKQKGIRCGHFCFIKGEEKEVRYRLQVTRWRNDPEDEMLDLANEYGWEYVDLLGDFHIWRTEDASARELITDSELQASAMEYLKRLERGSVVWTVIEALIFLFLVRGAFLLWSVTYGSWKVLVGCLLLLWGGIDKIKKFKDIKKMKQQLLLGETPGPIYYTEERNNRYRNKKVIRYIAGDIVMLLLCISYGKIVLSNPEQGEKVQVRVPFSTLGELCKEEGIVQNNRVWSVEVEEWSDILAPVNISWKEVYETGGWNEEGDKRSGYRNELVVAIHETRAPWIARCIAKDYGRQDSMEYWYIRDEYPDDMPELSIPGVDYLELYEFSPVELKGVLVKGKTVMYLSFEQLGEGRVSIEEWLMDMAESI